MTREPRLKPRRIRRTPEAAHDAILLSAHRLLLERGAQAVTFKAIADATAMTHGNVRHHFEGSSLLQVALIEYAAVKLSVRLRDSRAQFKTGQLTPEDLVKTIFDAFRESGCGRLVGWCSASGEDALLFPIIAVIEDHLMQFRVMAPSTLSVMSNEVGSLALNLISFALTASLLGNQLEKAIHAPEGCLQMLAVEALSKAGTPDH